ncbi:MAG: hypothetical protein IJZ81_00365 [Clostridia bacterium]|nr:hypothetical protein [Clostridia bacterium]
MKKFVTWTLLIALVLALTACGESAPTKSEETKSKDAEKVEELISDIGEVTLESLEAIEKAEEAYDELSRKEKKQVEAYEDLEEARETYEELVKEAEAKKVDDLIEAIGEVTVEKAAQIEEARKAYDALSDEIKKKVKKSDALDEAETQLTVVKQEAAETLLSGMRLEEDRVRNLKFYYPSAIKFYSNGSWAADIRSFILPYIGRDDSSTWLRLIYNYTGDDWVFYKSIIAAVDGKQYTKTFKYFDIVHDNESGDVWEYIDTEVSDYDIEMLWAIANSNETIVRFQGDNYSHDYTVNSTDKQAIKDVLTAYEALK